MMVEYLVEAKRTLLVNASGSYLIGWSSLFVDHVNALKVEMFSQINAIKVYLSIFFIRKPYFIICEFNSFS